ncbi:MAG: hypothetical protein MUF73_03700 [Rhodobacteraceae bacterium]|jgi:hypothetical protein|nr:hypothetical protein [Paracoccaceae bacterium]
MPTFRLVGFAPGASVAITVSQGTASSGAAVVSWGTPPGEFPRLEHGAETGFAVEAVSEDVLGPLSISLSVDGELSGTHVRTAVQQISGEAINHVSPTVTLTATPGTYATTGGLWTHGVDPVPTPVYQWLRNDVEIGGASGTSYATTTADRGTTLRCAVTVAGVGALSNAVAVPDASSQVSVAAGTSGVIFTAVSGVVVSAGTGGIIFAEA